MTLARDTNTTVILGLFFPKIVPFLLCMSLASCQGPSRHDGTRQVNKGETKDSPATTVGGNVPVDKGKGIDPVKYFKLEAIHYVHRYPRRGDSISQTTLFLPTDNSMVFMDGDGSLAKLSLDTGAIQWRLNSSFRGVIGNLLLWKDSIVLIMARGDIFFLDSGSGNVRAKVSLETHLDTDYGLTSRGLIYKGHLWLACDENKLFAVRLDDRKTSMIRLDSKYVSQPTVWNDQIVLVAGDRVYKVDVSRRRIATVFEVKTEAEQAFYKNMVCHGNTAAFRETDTIIGVDLKENSLKYRKKAPGVLGIDMPAIHNGVGVYITAYSIPPHPSTSVEAARVYGFDVVSGRPLWSFTRDIPIIYNISAKHGHLFYVSHESADGVSGDTQECLIARRIRDGTTSLKVPLSLKEEDRNSYFGAPIITDAGIILASTNGLVLKVTGDWLEKEPTAN